MAEKVTTMVIKADLGCDRCYKKIRKVLSSFPEIRDQVFDEKQNAVKITVVSCCPERIQKKICSKGGDSVKKIEIVPGDKKKEPEKGKDSTGDKKKDDAEKKGKEDESKKKKEGGGDKPKDKEPEKKPVPVPVPVPVSGYPSIFPPVYPVQGYYDPYHQVQVGGSGPVPCHQCHGMPHHSGSRVYSYGNQFDYFSEENPSACTVM